MADDKSKRDSRDRDRVSADDDYEVQYFAKKVGITHQLDSASPYDPFQQVGIYVLAIRIVSDQQGSLITPSVLWDVLFDDAFYEGAAQDIAVGSRYPWLGHDAHL